MWSRRWSDGAGAVLFAGDDAGDLPAFAALEDLRSGGTTTLGVAVLGAETPAAVRRAADVTVEGPAGLAELLTALAASASSTAGPPPSGGQDTAAS